MKWHTLFSLLLAGIVLVPSVSYARLDFYLADGNDGTEDQILRVYDTTTVGAKTMQDASGVVYGYPGDFVKVGTQYYGVDQANRRLYTIKPRTGLVTPVPVKVNATTVGSELFFRDITGLAYVPELNRLYYTASSADRMYYLTLGATPLTQSSFIVAADKRPQIDNLRALTYNPTDGLLYAYSAAFNSLLTIHPTTAVVSQLSTPMSEMLVGHSFEALTFVEGNLYALSSNNSSEAIVRKLDLTTGAMTNVTDLITGVSAHAMLINNLNIPALPSEIVPEPIFASSALAVFGCLALRRLPTRRRPSRLMPTEPTVAQIH